MYELYMDAVDKELSKLDSINELILIGVKKVERSIMELEQCTTDDSFEKTLSKTSRAVRNVKNFIIQDREDLDSIGDNGKFPLINLYLLRLLSQMRKDKKLLKYLGVKKFKFLLQFTDTINNLFSNYIEIDITRNDIEVIRCQVQDQDGFTKIQNLSHWNDKIIIIRNIVSIINKRDFINTYRDTIIILRNMAFGLLYDIKLSRTPGDGLNEELLTMKSTVESFVNHLNDLYINTVK